MEPPDLSSATVETIRGRDKSQKAHDVIGRQVGETPRQMGYVGDAGEQYFLLFSVGL